MYRARASGFAFFLIFFFCFSIISKGQSIDIGVKTGFNISNHAEKFLYAGNAITPESAFGYQVGGIIRTDLNNSLRATFEPSLIKLGANYTESITLQGQEYDNLSRTHLFYLHFPILVQLYQKPGSKAENAADTQSGEISYHFSAGFYGEYLLDAQFKGRNIENGTISRRFSDDIKTRYSNYDAGLMAGFGIELVEKVGFETRFQYTFLQTYKDEPQFKPKNYAFKLSISYILN